MAKRRHPAKTKILAKSSKIKEPGIKDRMTICLKINMFYHTNN